MIRSNQKLNAIPPSTSDSSVTLTLHDHPDVPRCTPMYSDRTSVHCLPPSMLDMGGSNLHCFLGAEDEDLDWDTQFSDSFSYSEYINQPLSNVYIVSSADNNATSFEDWAKQDLKSPSSATTTPTNTPTFPQSIANLPFVHTDALNNDEISPTYNVSPRAFQPSKLISPQNLHPKRPCSLQVDVEAPTRKRGRPRLNRTVSVSSANSEKSAEKPHKTRIPHTEVERKYRRGLNSELERLRRVIPTLPQIHDGTALGQARLSKAMVLSAAIDYIKRTEIERDAAMDELDRLRCE